MNYSVKPVNWHTGHLQLSEIRTQVFVEEQSVPADVEWDGKDDSAFHWIAVDDSNTPLGTARMLADGHIGRMAVLKHARNRGVGRALLQKAIEHARTLDIYEAYLYAQTHAANFYLKEGFVIHGDEFMEANIPHLTMRLTLFKQRLLGRHSGNFPILDYKLCAEQLVSQTQQKLLILSADLDQQVFNTATMVDYFSVLARKSRYTDIRLLVTNTSSIVNRGHRLLDLQRRLSSKISIRKASCEPHLIKQNLIIADNIGFICQSVSEYEKVWGNYKNLPVAETYVSEFNELWGQASEDRNLSLLGI